MEAGSGTSLASIASTSSAERPPSLGPPSVTSLVPRMISPDVAPPVCSGAVPGN